MTSTKILTKNHDEYLVVEVAQPRVRVDQVRLHDLLLVLLWGARGGEAGSGRAVITIV